MSDKATLATNVTINEYMTRPDANPHIPLLDVPITRISDLNLTNYMQYVCTHFDFCNIGEQEPGRLIVMPPAATNISNDHQYSRNIMLTKSASNLASSYATYLPNETLSYHIATKNNYTTGLMLESMRNLMSSYKLLIKNGPIVRLSASNQDPTLGLLTQGSAYAARYTNLFSVLNGTNALGVFETRSVDTMSLRGLSMEQAYTMLTAHVNDSSMASRNLTDCFTAQMCRVLRLSSTSQGDYVKMILMGRQNDTISATYAVRKARYFLMQLDEDVGSPAQSNYNGSLVDDYAFGWQHLVPIMQLSVVNSSYVVDGPSTYTTHLSYDYSNLTDNHMHLVASHLNCSRNGNLTVPTNKRSYTAATDLKISILILRMMTLPHYYENLFWTLPTCRMTDNASDLSHRFTVNWSLMIDEELKQVTPIYQVIKPGGPRPVRDSVIRSSLNTRTSLSDPRVSNMGLDEVRNITGKNSDSAIFGGFKEYIEELCPSETSLQRLYHGCADDESVEQLEYRNGAE
ncbi:hypothetical protein INT43_000856 [Umbelopsis isabellina]|uniref:Uncharacterized protein n=1 Tax=Mortierella isabellina TaxID=91625 RepID=A0A8H7UM84_MORIS|nr:hypothetical protein INT43_000856 [Umbelopsis isabellina]